MKLEELIQKRFVSTAALAERLTTYNGVPAVFSPEAPGDEQEGWGGETQYPMVSLHTAGNVGIWQAAIFFTHRTADSNRLPGSATRLLFTTDTKGGRRYGNCRVLRTWQ